MLATPAAAQITPVPFCSDWKYLDTAISAAPANNPTGVTWKQAGFTDTAWPTDNAQFGFGDGDEEKVVSSTARFTTYFRKKFTLTSTQHSALQTNVILEVIADDGAAIYINNGTARLSNMSGTIVYNTPASTTRNDYRENNYRQTGANTSRWSVPKSQLVVGENIIAVEVHQSSATSSDLSFDLRLRDSTAPGHTRGPWLQKLGPDRVTICWETDQSVIGTVKTGTSPTTLGSPVSEPTAGTRHAVTLTGLSPSQKIFYSIGDANSGYVKGSRYFFKTAPVSGTAQTVRIWAIGDSGFATPEQESVRVGFIQNFNRVNGVQQHIDAWLMLGDNAYDNGTESEYQEGVFEIYPSTLWNSALWPTLGNHDAYTTPHPYFDIFSLPVAGECGGVASGTENYYSFDYANIHFVCLDSMDVSRAVGGAMYNWLDQDLAATTAEWIIAFWHHPPYTKGGGHDSDNATDSDGRMKDMRERFTVLCEQYGVDVVLCGHSHSYERTFLIDGHTGVSSTFNSNRLQLVRQKGSGHPNLTTNPAGPYVKPYGLGNAGAVYIVGGSSGEARTDFPTQHPATFTRLGQLGSCYLEVSSNQLTMKFVRDSGVVGDEFVLQHHWDGLNNWSEDEPQSVTLDSGIPLPSGAIWNIDSIVNGTYTGTPPNITITPTLNFVGTVSINYSVQSQSGATDPDKFTAKRVFDGYVFGVDDQPTISGPITLTVQEGQSVPFSYTISDPENDSYNEYWSTSYGGGSLSVSNGSGTYGAGSYLNSTSDTITLALYSSVGGGPIYHDIAVTITPEPTQVSSPGTSTYTDTAVDLEVTYNEPHGWVVSGPTITSQPSHGSITWNDPNPGGSAGTVYFTYTPDTGYTGPDSFSYEFSNGANTSSGTGSVTVGSP